MAETITYAAWMDEGNRRFGPDNRSWKFVCPVCGHVASIGDFEQYKDQGATMNSATCECIGRYTGAGDFKPKGQGPCNYAGYGLFRLSPIRITGISPDHSEDSTHCFAFAEAPAT